MHRENETFFLSQTITTITTKNMWYEDFEDYEDNNCYDDDCPTYERYNGSYAQDVEGWSDQDIDNVLDGDPDAYWNID